VGARSLALGVLTAAVALRFRRVHPAVCAAGWLVYGAPHLLYRPREDAQLAPWDRRLSLAAPWSAGRCAAPTADAAAQIRVPSRRQPWELFICFADPAILSG
jgi:hypothetical protein